MSEKKSQIQQIKEGRAMREHRYSGRLQPFGPMPKPSDLEQRVADPGQPIETWAEKDGREDAPFEKRNRS